MHIVVNDTLSYKKLRKAELVKLCADRGIDPASCRTNADLIAALEPNNMYNDLIINENENDNDVNDSNDDDASADDDDEYVTDDDRLRERQDDIEGSDDGAARQSEKGSGKTREGVCRPTLPRQGEAESVAALRLRLALAKEERLMREREWTGWPKWKDIQTRTNQWTFWHIQSKPKQAMAQRPTGRFQG